MLHDLFSSSRFDLRERRLRPIGLVGVLLCLACSTGCSRNFWRLNADANTYAVLAQKTADPRWSAPRLDLQPDPRSRFFDPYDPDHEPLPPDDPTAHQYMHHVFGMRGSKCWHQNGDLLSVENPQWLDPFMMEVPAPPDDPNGIPSLTWGIKELTLPQALELSYIHSREYQTQLEALYSSSLALTFERFRFNVRYLGFGGEPSSNLTYEGIPSGTDSLAYNNRFGVSQLLPTGGQWIVEMANNTLWLFSGDNRTNSASVLSYSLVQPLLLGAGRKVTLENLTQSERNALYAARDFARFRQEFFVNTVSGGGTTGSAYLGLLRLRQSVLNQENNIFQLTEQVERLRALSSEKPEEISETVPALPDGFMFPPEFEDVLRYDRERGILYWRGEMSVEQARILGGLSENPDYARVIRELYQRSQGGTVTLDVTQLETQLAGARSALLQSERGLQDALDLYKIQLGLPPDLELTVDQRLLRPFQLIDPQLDRLQVDLTSYVAEWGKLNGEEPIQKRILYVARGLQQLQDRIRVEGLGLVQLDFDRVRVDMEQRIANGEDSPSLERKVSDVARDRRLYESIAADFAASAEELNRWIGVLSEPGAPEEILTEAIRMIAELREDLLKVSQNLSVIQIGLRVELIELNDFEMSMEEATQTSLENRVDLKNARALVMDARRKEEIAANRLEAVLDIRVEGDIRTPGIGSGNNKPLNFQADQSSFRAGVSFTAPLDQVAERNVYRQALINYQQSRRDYMAFEDQVKFQVRRAWRQLRVLRENFEISRQSVRLAAMQLDQAIEETTAPVAQGQRRANQGLNLLNALNAVLRAQNDLIQNWIDYETNRLNIHRDMGIMQIDERGIWYDSYYQHSLPAAESPDSPELTLPPEPAPPALPVLESRHDNPAKTDSPRNNPAPFRQDPRPDDVGTSARSTARRGALDDVARPVVGPAEHPVSDRRRQTRKS